MNLKKITLFNESEINFLVSQYKLSTIMELTFIFNEKFKRNLKITQIKSFLMRNKIKSGRDVGFFHGNKYSTKNYDYLIGIKPKNTLPIGTERIRRDRYIYIKVGEPSIWMSKHRYLYEKYKGKIPSGCNVIFKDGNNLNFNLDNLELVNKIEHGLFTKYCIDNNMPESLRDTAFLISKIEYKVRY